jgi:hypothetical protein
MSLQDDLVAIERRLWSGGKAAYRRALDDSCLLAFAAMAGVSSRDTIADRADASRWRELQMELEGFLQPTRDVALLTYLARVVRADRQPYTARVSSGYVKRDGGWKMMFHQQTPLEISKQRPTIAEPAAHRASRLNS